MLSTHLLALARGRSYRLVLARVVTPTADGLGYFLLPVGESRWLAPPLTFPDRYFDRTMGPSCYHCLPLVLLPPRAVQEALGERAAGDSLKSFLRGYLLLHWDQPLPLEELLQPLEGALQEELCTWQRGARQRLSLALATRARERSFWER